MSTKKKKAPQVSISTACQLLFDKETAFICDHSGGKDSQAMFLFLQRMVPAEQLFIVHSHLPEVEWDGTVEHIEATCFNYRELHVVQAGKTFFDMVESRGMFPSPKNRQCTSDLKRNPIDKKIREICKRLGFKRVVNCMGLRAEESSGRAKKPVFRYCPDKSAKGRDWYEWLPIHDKSTTWVFNFIHKNGQRPFWVYAAGMKRKSCAFCIYSSHEDIRTAATLRPELAQKYISYERKYDHTLLMPSGKKGRMFIDEIINQPTDPNGTNGLQRPEDGLCPG